MGCCPNSQSGIDGADSRPVVVEQNAYDESWSTAKVNGKSCLDAEPQQAVVRVCELAKASLKQAETAAGARAFSNSRAKVTESPELQMQHVTAPHKEAFVEQHACCVDAETRQAVAKTCGQPKVPWRGANAAAGFEPRANSLAEVMQSPKLPTQQATTPHKRTYVEQHACDESTFAVKVNATGCVEAEPQQAAPRMCELPNVPMEEAKAAAGIGVCANSLAKVKESPQPQKQHATAPNDGLSGPRVQPQQQLRRTQDSKNVFELKDYLKVDQVKMSRSGPAKSNHILLPEAVLPPCWDDHAEHEAKLRKALKTFALEPELLLMQVMARRVG